MKTLIALSGLFGLAAIGGAALGALSWFGTLEFLTAALFGVFMGVFVAYAIWRAEWHSAPGIALVALACGGILIAVRYIVLHQFALRYGFVGDLRAFIDSLLRYGYQVTSTYSPIPRQTSPGETLITVVAECLALTILPTAAAVVARRRAFCAHCRRYYGIISFGIEKANIVQVGAVPIEQALDFNQSITGGAWDAAAALIVPTTEDDSDLYTHAHLHEEACPTCRISPVLLHVDRMVGTGANRKLEEIGRHSLTWEARDRLRFPQQMRGPGLDRWLRSQLAIMAFGLALLVGASVVL